MTTKVTSSVLSTTGVTTGTYGGSSALPVIKIESDGRISSAANVAFSSFPSGTRMVFQQTSAPTGWTKDTTAGLDDSIMRIVTGTASSGGSTAFSTFNGQTSVGATTLDTTQIPSHAHSYTRFVGTTAYSTGGVGSLGNTGSTTGSTGGGGSHTHSLSVSIKYYDFIIASKD